MQAIFEIFLLISKPGEIFYGERVFLKRNLICYISGMEGHI